MRGQALPLRLLYRLLVILVGCTGLLACGEVPVPAASSLQTRATTDASAAPDERPVASSTMTCTPVSIEPPSGNPQSFLACGCGCCSSETLKPQKRCLFRSKGDDLARMIAEDKRMSADDQLCATVGCSAGIAYMYCDE